MSYYSDHHDFVYLRERQNGNNALNSALFFDPFLSYSLMEGSSSNSHKEGHTYPLAHNGAFLSNSQEYGLGTGFTEDDPPLALKHCTTADRESITASTIGTVVTGFAPCAICGKTPKNESGAKRHAFQHTKPFMCGEPGCVKADGFATKNDVERHRKSVHGLNLGVGKAGRFFCPVQGCREAKKSWARLDNLRSHVRRKHPMSLEAGHSVS